MESEILDKGITDKMQGFVSRRNLGLMMAGALGVSVAVWFVRPAQTLNSPLATGRSDTVLMSRRATENSPSLLLISIDTLRADHMGIYGYSRPTTPHIDSWFEEGQIYDAAYSTEASTPPSVVSFLTGMLPQEHGVRLFYQKIPPDVVTVADLLCSAGYQTAAVVSNIVLTAEAIGLDTRFDHYDDFVDETEPYREMYERRASRTTDAALVWLSSWRDPSRPNFLWVHYIDPHGPYHPPPDRPTDFTNAQPIPIDIERVPEYEREPGVNDGAEYIDLYDEEIAYMDREVGRLLDAYEQLGLAENSLVLFTADHGESMMEHELWFTHGYHVYEEILRVPLLVRGLGVQPGRIPHPVSLADVAPTLLQAAGLQLPPGLYGQRLSETGPQREIFAEAGSSPQWRSMWRGKEKWMVQVNRSNHLLDKAMSSLPGLEKLVRRVEVEHRYYDLDEDPKELRPRPWPASDQARSLVKLVHSDPDPAGIPSPTRVSRGHKLEAPKVPSGLDKRTLERLRSLGYVR